MKRYLALWYERDEYDQWVETENFETKEDAMRAAFKNASKGDCHLYAEVHEATLVSIHEGWEDTGEWINSVKDGNKWSGWMDGEKYRATYT